ncbi:hypothetical protein MANES_10G076111v8 [Manihot esculenta]|uniref:Uncharacterized protein n=1 Tax=Manihot esculenta TaxID=3983 RepID=A0ACB7H1G2_MANES|nr:hypothetical protein MANES_10G076111v8 [Manihot esculenta]
MELQTLSDALMCKVFPTTLSGPARAWFNSLEAGSIKSFGDLATRFISRFIAGVPADRKTSYLETVKQKEGESLREYVARFNTEALQIPELDEGRAVEAMQKGTTSAEFFGSLSRKPPTSLAELMKRAEKYIRQDDALVTSRFAKGMAGKEKAPEERRPERHEKKHGKRPEPYKQAWERRDQRPPPPPRALEPRMLPPWVPKKPTPLNASRAEVLMAVQDKEFLQWPKPMKSEADQRNPDKYCQYHRSHGHDTNNYFQLIAEIERLIKRGHLKNFVKKPEGQRPQPGPTTQTPRRIGAGPVNDGSSGTINMIVGGTGGRMSRRGKKRNREGETSNSEVMQIIEHSPMTIAFSPEDAQGIQMPHDDALVIEAVINNFRVKKVLVDDGSKVNLLPYRVFQQMRIPEEQLVRDQSPIKGIGGAPILVEGKVKLALTLGEAPRARTHHEVFLVVKLPLSYNAILGRPALFDFEAVTSIRAILQGLKKRLDGAKENWAEELNSILWALRTTPRAPTKETPFALAYGTEAVVPVELQIPTHRVQFVSENTNEDKLRSNLDALEEVREEAQVRTAAYQQRAARYYNQKVRERSLKVGDLTLRNLEATGKRAAVGKLAPTWEGPFKVTKVVKPGVYRIEDMQGNPEPHAWNIQHLKRYFP